MEKNSKNYKDKRATFSFTTDKNVISTSIFAVLSTLNWRQFDVLKHR